MKDALALALVHFIWQGAGLAFAGALLMRVVKTPAVRYSIGVATLFAMSLAPVMTTVAIARADSESTFNAVPRTDASTSSERSPIVEHQPAAVIRDGHTSSQGIIIPTTWILNLWTIGVIVLSLRLVGGWAVARGLARQTLCPVGDELQALAADMARRLRVRAVVRVCESASMAVPVMLGCLRPVIILPAAAVSALPLAQLEALLAHELAHIRRHDYLVNLLQTCVETLCFYHPAVWWISREVRRHREECCDDVVVEVCDRLTYVTALSSVASFATPQLALSATGGSLRDRVRRLVDPSTSSSSPKGVWIAMLPILLVVALVTPEARGEQNTATPATAAVVSSAAAPAAVATAAVSALAAEQAIESSAAQEARRARAEAELEKTKQAVAAMLERIKAEQGVASERRATELDKLRNDVEARLERMKVEQGVARERNEARQAARNAEIAETLERVKEARVSGQRRAEVLSERQRLATGSDQAALEMHLRALEQTLARQKELVEKGLMTRDNPERVEEQIARYRDLIERSNAMSGWAERNGEQRVESSAELQPQDRLMIEIEGEPELPREFTVRSDGSIRFPFLGNIRVQGSTTSQVQSVIRKLLSDRKLVSNPEVTVSARRRR